MAYLMTVLVIDHEENGKDGAIDLIENAKYVRPSVVGVEEADIGEWHDDHPLNKQGRDLTVYFPSLKLRDPVPVLYLDFDDVVNDDAWFDTPDRLELGRRIKAARDYDAVHALQLEAGMLDIRPEYVARVKRIVDTTGCRVVVCSNWRSHFSNDELGSFLKPHGIEIDGATRRPRMSEYHDIRLDAILTHAATLPFGTKWCVLDDMVDTPMVEKHGGKAVTPVGGVTEENADQVIRYLTGRA